MNTKWIRMGRPEDVGAIPESGARERSVADASGAFLRKPKKDYRMRQSMLTTLPD